MNDRDNAFLGTEPVGGLLFRLAVPTITAQVINMLYNVVDRVYIGHMGAEGDMALTGVGVAMPVTSLSPPSRPSFPAAARPGRPSSWDAGTCARLSAPWAGASRRRSPSPWR